MLSNYWIHTFFPEIENIIIIEGHSCCKHCLHDLQFMKTRSSLHNFSKLARADISCQFMKTRSLSFTKRMDFLIIQTYCQKKKEFRSLWRLEDFSFLMDAYEVKVDIDIFQYQESLNSRFFFHFSMAYYSLLHSHKIFVKILFLHPLGM